MYFFTKYFLDYEYFYWQFFLKHWKGRPYRSFQGLWWGNKLYNPLERDSGRKRGFAFVEINSENFEKTAIDDLQDAEWMGREIRVNNAAQKDHSTRNNRHNGSKNKVIKHINKNLFWFFL